MAPGQDLYNQRSHLEQPTLGPTFSQAEGGGQSAWIPIIPFSAQWEHGDKVLTQIQFPL